VNRLANELSAAAAAAQIRQGDLTSEKLVQACLDRVDLREPEIDAWAHIDPDRALSQARACDAEPPRGPLHGIPVAIKDVIDTADMPTGHGSPIYDGHRPAIDAECVAMLRAAGAVILGKTVATEFAAITPGKTANPHNPAHTPGGSSSGSAAAVADRMAPLALGTQTVGLTIRPAAYCGVVGFKPSYGTFGLRGVLPQAPSVETLGLFSRDVADLSVLADGLIGGEGAFAAGNPGRHPASAIARRRNGIRRHRMRLAQWSGPANCCSRPGRRSSRSTYRARSRLRSMRTGLFSNSRSRGP
jgi:amidase